MGLPRLFKHDVNFYGLPFQTKFKLKLTGIFINNNFRLGKEVSQKMSQNMGH